MFNAIQVLWPLLIVAVLIIAFKFIVAISSEKPKSKSGLSVYEKKPYLFDSSSEFNLYKILLELFGDKYFIFPQINYSHLIQPKKTTWAEERKYRSRIDRKSADFVLCDKERIVPQLVIELDGSAHNYKRKQVRDKFIDGLTKTVNLPILHLRAGNLDKEVIRKEIEQKLEQ